MSSAMTQRHAFGAFCQDSPARLVEVRVKVLKKPGEMLGMGCMADAADDCKAAVVSIKPGGLIYEWNASHPACAVAIGDVLAEVNGVREMGLLVRELARASTLEMVFERATCDSDEYRAMMSGMGAEMEQWTACSGHRPTMCQSFLCLPTVSAELVGECHCAICLEDVDPDEKAVQLACGHSYHWGCMAQWLTRGHRAVCPLCIRAVE